MIQYFLSLPVDELVPQLNRKAGYPVNTPLLLYEV